MSEFGFNAPPPSDWIFDVRGGTWFDPSGGWLFTAFAPRDPVSAAQPRTRLEVFYLPVREARGASPTRLVDYLVQVLNRKREAVGNATASPAASSGVTSATVAMVSSDLTAYVRVAPQGTLPELLARAQDGQYAIAVDMRADSTAPWQKHWAVVRAGEEIIYGALGVPGTYPTHQQQLEVLMSSITVELPNDKSGP